MHNHPSRAWRAKMRAACEAWLARWRWPTDGAACVLLPNQLRETLTQAYVSGYEDGRASKTPKEMT